MNMILAESVTTISAAPYLGVIVQLVMWTGLIIVLAMFKSYVTHGLSLAFAEVLFKMGSEEAQEKACSWMADSKQVLKFLKEMKKRSCK